MSDITFSSISGLTRVSYDSLKLLEHILRDSRWTSKGRSEAHLITHFGLILICQ